MAASLASSLASTFSVALRRTSLLPITGHQSPTTISLTKPTNFPSIRAQSGENELATFVDGVAKDAKSIISDGKEKVEEVAGKAMEIAADGWNEGKEGFADMADKANELAENLAGDAGNMTEISIEKTLAVKKSVEETANVAVEKGGEDIKKGVDTVVAVKDTTVEAAGDLAEKTTEMVAETIDAAKGN